MRRFTLTILSLLFMAGLELFGASLPVNGGYYRIRNASSSTYIGGTGTGNNAVIHQSSSVDSVYQIFRITVNSSNKYITIQQKESGLFVTHNNSYVGSYAAKTGNNRQNFYVDSITNVDYCVIKRIKDDNSIAMGVGYDDVTPGATIYMDKSNTNKWNQWIFEPIISLCIADLDTVINEATALNPTALASAITSASAYRTSTSDVDIMNAVTLLKTAIDNYKIQALLESAKTATQEVPVNVTGLLVNPSFEEGGLNGWTNNGMGLQSNALPKKTGTVFVEKWIASTATSLKSVADASISQTLKMSVPNGKYRLVAMAQGLQQGDTITHMATSPSGVSLFGNIASIEVRDSAIYTLENIIVVDHTLTFGIKTVSATANWVAADNFQLYYQGVDLTALSNSLSALVTTGGSITGVIQTSVSTELASAITQANGALSSPEELALNASIARMVAAIDAANASKAIYLSLSANIGIVTDTVTTYVGPNYDKTAINASIAAAQGIYDAHLLNVAETQAAKDSLTKALLNFQMDNASEVRPVILTSLIVNPNFSANNGTGWTGATGGANFSEYELYNKSTFDFNQTITGLRKGQYKVTVQGFHRPGNYSDALEAAYDNGTEVMPIVLYANTKTSLFSSAYSDKTCSAASGAWTDANGILFPNNMQGASLMFAAGKYGNNQVSGYVGESGTLTFGLKNSGTPVGASWTIFDNFQLSYIGMPALAGYIEDLQTAAVEAFTVFNGINVATQVSAQGEKVIGKYRYSAWFTLDSMLTVQDELINSYNNDEFTGQISDILAVQTALIAAKNAMVIYLPKNELPNGEYFIKVADMFYWNNPGIGILADETAPGVANSGLVMDLNVADGSQIVKVAKLSGVTYTQPIERYSMFSLLDGRNISEKCFFKTLWGDVDDDWRTHNLFYNGTAFAVQGAGSSANRGFWFYNIDAQNLNASGVTAFADSFCVFNFIPVKTVFAAEVPKGRTAFNSAVVGAEPEQYQQVVYDAFKTALEAAEAVIVAGTATSTNLFAYEAALNSFLKNNQVAVKQVKDNSVSAIGGKRMIRVMSNNAEKVTIFSLTGSVVSSTVSAGTYDIAVDPGCYLVKINNRITKVIVK